MGRNEATGSETPDFSIYFEKHTSEPKESQFDLLSVDQDR